VSISPAIIDQAQRALGSAPQPLDNILGTTQATDRARSVVSSLYATSAGLATALDWAQRVDDPNLSPEGIDAAKTERLKGVAAALKSRTGVLAPHLEAAVSDAQKAAEPHFPKLNEADVAQGNRISSAWQLAVLPQLEKGKSWDAIISTLDHDGLLAVKRFAPTHEAAQRDALHQHEVPGILAGIERMSDQRAIDSAPEGPARQAMQQLQAVRAHHDAATTALNAIGGIANSAEAGDMYGARRAVVPASIAIKRAAHDVGADPATVAASTTAAA
jgi:hypothetical protein